MRSSSLRQQGSFFLTVAAVLYVITDVLQHYVLPFSTTTTAVPRGGGVNSPRRDNAAASAAGVIPFETKQQEPPPPLKNCTSILSSVPNSTIRTTEASSFSTVYGHLHYAKTAGTTLNGRLAAQYERVCVGTEATATMPINSTNGWSSNCTNSMQRVFRPTKRARRMPFIKRLNRIGIEDACHPPSWRKLGTKIAITLAWKIVGRCGIVSSSIIIMTTGGSWNFTFPVAIHSITSCPSATTDATPLTVTPRISFRKFGSVSSFPTDFIPNWWNNRTKNNNSRTSFPSSVLIPFRSSPIWPTWMRSCNTSGSPPPTCLGPRTEIVSKKKTVCTKRTMVRWRPRFDKTWWNNCPIINGVKTAWRTPPRTCCFLRHARDRQGYRGRVISVFFKRQKRLGNERHFHLNFVLSF